MSIYTVSSTQGAATPRFNGVNAYLVQANSTAEAKQLAKVAVDGDSDALWAAATVADAAAAVTLMTGWTVRIQVNTSTPVDVSVVGGGADDLDAIMAKVVTALLTGTGSVGTAISGTAHSAYNSSTNVLTVSSIADGIGNKTLTVTVTPPTGLFQTDYTWDQTNVYLSKVDGGISGAVLTATFSTTWVVPGKILAYKQAT